MVEARVPAVAVEARVPIMCFALWYWLLAARALGVLITRHVGREPPAHEDALVEAYVART